MEEKRSFVGLKSWKKEQLTPFIDVKNEGASKERIALANSMNRAMIIPIITCSIEGEDGIFILDGVQRWKMIMENDALIKCYHLGMITRDDALKYWFMLDIHIEDNILKVMDMLSTLRLELLMEVSRCSKYDEKDFADFKKLLEFDWQKYLRKIDTNNKPIQKSLFDL